MGAEMSVASTEPPRPNAPGRGHGLFSRAGPQVEYPHAGRDAGQVEHQLSHRGERLLAYGHPLLPAAHRITGCPSPAGLARLRLIHRHGPTSPMIAIVPPGCRNWRAYPQLDVIQGCAIILPGLTKSGGESALGTYSGRISGKRGSRGS